MRGYRQHTRKSRAVRGRRIMFGGVIAAITSMFMDEDDNDEGGEK